MKGRGKITQKRQEEETNVEFETDIKGVVL